MVYYSKEKIDWRLTIFSNKSGSFLFIVGSENLPGTFRNTIKQSKELGFA